MANYISQVLYNTEQIKELEQKAMSYDALQVSDLMDRAGKAVFLALKQKWPEAKKIAIVCGKGNNAGDGFVAAKYAALAGYEVSILNLTAIEDLKSAAAQAQNECEKLNIPIKPFAEEYLPQCDVIVDAILGTGFFGTLSDTFSKAIAAINKSGKPILAIDIPSGLDANTGSCDDAVTASLTITFIGLKRGLYTGKGRDYSGSIVCDDLGLSKRIFEEVQSNINLLNLQDLFSFLPKRKKSANKGNFGHVLVIGGDYGMEGAAAMAGEAVLRVGAGLVSVATHKEHIAAINARRPEIMCFAVEKASQLDALLKRATVIVIGPGLGKSKWSKKLLAKVLQSQLPKIIDADALNLLDRKVVNAVLTPHPGEASRMLGLTIADIERDRFAAIDKLQKQYGNVVVLKGSGSLVKSEAMATTGLCPFGNPGMASGGMGDVLSGIIGALAAQKLPLNKAAEFGVCLHATAADLAAEDGERGLLASDLFMQLRKLINE